MNKYELANEYGISIKTLQRRMERSENLQIKLKSMGYKDTDKYLTPAQTNEIYNFLGTPKK